MQGPGMPKLNLGSLGVVVVVVLEVGVGTVVVPGTAVVWVPMEAMECCYPYP